MNSNNEKIRLKAKLQGSLIEFTRYFYPLLTGRKFIVSEPIGRESHARLELPNHKLLINVSPGSGKSTLLAMWVAWTMAKYPDSRFLYISYSKVLAAKHTETIKRIMQLSTYSYLFDVRIRHDSKAREYFQTTNGGAVAAFGSGGAITGQDAGLPGLGRFTGAVIIDDAHKPDEVHSDTIRVSVIDNYRETIQQRARGINVPTIFLGQRLHEDDLAAYLIAGKDGYEIEYRANDPLNVSRYGIPEPIKQKKLVPTILLIPMVAFDKNCNRLGYGGGFYDRFLEKNQNINLIKIGLAFSFQKVNFICT